MQRSQLDVRTIPFFLRVAATGLACGGVLFALQEAPVETASSGAVELQYLPEVGSRLQQTWKAHHKLVATEVITQVAGSEPIVVNRLPGLETLERRTCTDLVRAVQGGQILDLRRSWDQAVLWGKMDFGFKESKPIEVELQSPLGRASVSVVYTHIPEENGYGLHYDQSAMAERMLSGLRMDMSLADLVPAGPVKVGHKWAPPLNSLLPMLAPAGDLTFNQVRSGGALLVRTLLMGVGACMEKVWNPQDLSGSLNATLERVELVEGRRLAHIRLNYSFVTTRDRSSQARDFHLRGERIQGMQLLGNTVRLSGEGSIVLVWDVLGKRASSYKLRGRETIEMEVRTQALNAPIVSQRMALGGALEVDCELRSLPDVEVAPSWTVQRPKVTPTED